MQWIKIQGSVFSLIHLYICGSVTLLVCPDQTKNDTDLKFGTHTPLDHI